MSAPTQRIEQQAVDGEVAALHVFFGVLRVAHLIGMAAIGVRAVGAERCDLGHASFFDRSVLALRRDRRRNQHHAEVRAHRKGARKHFQHHIRSRGSRDVVVLRLAAQQQIAHAPAGEIGLVARRAQGLEDLQCCFELG